MNNSALITSIRKAIVDTQGDSRRAFHGRGHCYPGLEALCIDLFAPVVWVSLFAEPGELSNSSSALTPSTLDELLAAIVEQLDGTAFDCVLVQHRYDKSRDVSVIHGTPPQRPLATEGGAHFELMLSGNQNVGLFLDAEPARSWLRENCEGLRVLNLFAYTCAFSVAAVQGKAERVVNIDMSRNAMRVGERNHSLNFSSAELERNRVKFFPHEIFRSIARLEKNGPYDIIIVDPPSHQAGSFTVDKDYPKLLRKLPRLLRKQGQVLCMLNAPNRDQKFLEEIVAANFPALKLTRRLPNSEDFPDQSVERQLKMLLFQHQCDADSN